MENVRSLTPKRTVYSCYWPETKEKVDQMWSEKLHVMYEDPHFNRQDDMHLPFLQGWRQWGSRHLHFGTEFPNQYPCNGASEAIFHLVARTRERSKIHVFAGEYEGYQKSALSLGRKVEVHHGRLELMKYWKVGKYDVCFISEPSAITGCSWAGFHEFVTEVGRRFPQMKIYVDVTYMGATIAPPNIDFTKYPNVEAVIFSLSKPFGVYYHRIGGVLSRDPINSLYPNFWFKNLFSLELGRRLIETYDILALPKKYRPVQLAVMAELNKTLPEVTPSEVVLLGKASTGTEEFARAPNQYRYCITPELARRVGNEYNNHEGGCR